MPSTWASFTTWRDILVEGQIYWDWKNNLFCSQVCHHQIRAFRISHFHLNMYRIYLAGLGLMNHASWFVMPSNTSLLRLQPFIPHTWGLSPQQAGPLFPHYRSPRKTPEKDHSLMSCTYFTIFPTNLKFVLPVLLLQPLLRLKYLLDCPARHSIVSQYLHHLD